MSLVFKQPCNGGQIAEGLNDEKNGRFPHESPTIKVDEEKEIGKQGLNEEGGECNLHYSS